MHASWPNINYSKLQLEIKLNFRLNDFFSGDLQVFFIVSAFSKTLKISGQEYQLELVDTAGQVYHFILFILVDELVSYLTFSSYCD